MRTPSSRHLSHDFPAYKGLTLRELAVIVMVFTSLATVLFIGVGLAIGFPVGMGCLGFLAGVIVGVAFLPTPIARRKSGKPHGYLMKTLVMQLSRWKLKTSPYLHHVGRWQKSKHIRGRNV